MAALQRSFSRAQALPAVTLFRLQGLFYLQGLQEHKTKEKYLDFRSNLLCIVKRLSKCLKLDTWSYGENNRGSKLYVLFTKVVHGAVL